MLALGLVAATRPVLSWDEVATADAAARTYGQLWHLAPHIDAVFTPYYALMHVWTSVAGHTVLALRLPSILTMAAAVAVTGELGRRRFGPLAGLLAGLLVCILPNSSRYADEARPYAIACLLAIVALLLLDRYLERPVRIRLIAYGMAVLGLGLSHIVALSVLAGHLVIVLRARRLRGPWCAAVAAVIVVLAPLMWAGFRERHVQLYWVPPVTIRSVLAMPGWVVGSLLVAALILELFGVALWQSGPAVVDTAVAAIVPAMLVLVVSVAGASFWVPRYLLVVVAPAMLVAGVGLVRVGAYAGRTGSPARGVRGLRIIVVCLVFAAVAVPSQEAVRGPTSKNGSDWRTAAAVIQQNQQPGDAVVYTPRSRTLRAGLDAYLRDDASRPRDVLLRESAARAGTLVAVEFPDPSMHLSGVRRVWLFVAGRHPDPTVVVPLLRPLLRTQFVLARVWPLHRGTLALFVRLQ